MECTHYNDVIAIKNTGLALFECHQFPDIHYKLLIAVTPPSVGDDNNVVDEVICKVSTYIC